MLLFIGLTIKGGIEQMTTLNIVLTVIDIILAIAIIILFLVQEGNDQGIGVGRKRALILKSATEA